jgi:formylglycine-generating enzyme required for sulfatase activity
MRVRASRASLALLPVAAALLLSLPTGDAEAKKKAGCPTGMKLVGGKVCVDLYEAHVVEVLDKKKTKLHPYYQSVAGKTVRAQSKKGVYPQGYISRNEAADACDEAGKRLCSDKEWLRACRGKNDTQFPYGDEREPKVCNDTKAISPLNHFFGKLDDSEKYGSEKMNDPRLNQLAGTLTKTGAKTKCKTTDGLFDMVGNLHEWTNDPAGTFRGGYYLDTTINGDGCGYKTTAHVASYHDYSTGFRCCKDP